MRAALIFVFALILTGCQTSPEVGVSWQFREPEPYKACTVVPQVIIHEGIPYVGYTYADSVEKALCEERLLNYIKQLHDVLDCYKGECIKETNEQRD